MAIGMNEELSIDILSQTPLIPLCLNVANDAEKNIGIRKKISLTNLLF